jgi:hypothetical protein
MRAIPAGEEHLGEEPHQVEVDGSMVDDGTDLEATFERMRLLVVGEDDV